MLVSCAVSLLCCYGVLFWLIVGTRMTMRKLALFSLLELKDDVQRVRPYAH